MNEAEKLEFECEVDEEGRIKITDDIQKAAGIVSGSIVTAKMKPLLDSEKNPVEMSADKPKYFEFTDQVDEEGRIRISDMIKKFANTEPGDTVSINIVHVLSKDLKPAKKLAHKFQFLDEVDEEGRIRIPDMIKKSASIVTGNVVSISIKHVLDSKEKPVERVLEGVDTFEFTSEVDDEGRICISEDMRNSVPIAPGSIVTVKLEQILDSSQ